MSRASSPAITVLAGGVGGARFLDGLQQVLPASALTAIVNTGDDLTLWGLRVCPDLDSVLYTLGGHGDAERGWGLAGETWQVRDALQRLGEDPWFALGDRDLATHLVRTQLLGQGLGLAAVIRILAERLAVRPTVLPMTEDPAPTLVRTPAGELEFQDYFVRRQHADPVQAVLLDAARAARPAPGVLDALRAADRVFLAPSNPFVSLDPILAVPGIREALLAVPVRAAVSPIIGGAAVRGPAARMLADLGQDPSSLGVAQYFRDVLTHFVLDQQDAHLVPAVQRLGLQAIVTDTLMTGRTRRRDLAAVVLAATA